MSEEDKLVARVTEKVRFFMASVISFLTALLDRLLILAAVIVITAATLVGAGIWYQLSNDVAISASYSLDLLPLKKQ